MDFDFLESKCDIRDAVKAICNRFDDAYWRDRDSDGKFPFEFRNAIAEAGWLGLTMPEEYGGAGLGVSDAAVMMHTIANSGGGMAAASSIHINMFGPHPITVFGTNEQKARWIPKLVDGSDQVCFGVTEPDAGLNTTNIKTFAKKVDGGYLVSGRKMWTSTAQVSNKIMLAVRTTKKEDCAKPTDGLSLFYTDFDREKIEVRRIDKMGRKAVDSNAIFIDDYFIPDEDLLGEEGKGFRYLLHSLNPERVMIAAEAVGLGQDALARATQYAKERIVFDRPIVQNQGIQHPLAECWMNLEAAWKMTQNAAARYDAGVDCGAQANAAKFLAAKAGFKACEVSVLSHGGMGYAKEFNVERLFRESMIMRIAPVTEQMIMCFVAERVLGLPKSY